MKQERLLRVSIKIGLGAVAAYGLAFLTLLFLVFVVNDINMPGAVVMTAALFLGFAANLSGLALMIIGEFACDAQRWKWTKPFLLNVVPPAMTYWLMLQAHMLLIG